MTKLGALSFLFVCVILLSATNKPSAKEKLIATVNALLSSSSILLFLPLLSSTGFERNLAQARDMSGK